MVNDARLTDNDIHHILMPLPAGTDTYRAVADAQLRKALNWALETLSEGDFIWATAFLERRLDEEGIKSWPEGK